MSAVCSWCGRPATDEDPLTRPPLRPSLLLCSSCYATHRAERE